MGNLERVLEIIAICIIYEDCYSIKRKKMERLYKKLESYGQSDYYPFHMPGHKGNRASSADDFLFERDITEISGFDNLHHAEGILKEAQEYAAQIYGTKKCFFGVNGSTAALLAAVSASVNKGGKILVARNCHKAVYHALYLRELQPVYIYPHEDQRLGINGGISPERVERYLEENTDVQAFLLTSPTYDGVVSDIKTIAEVVHRHKIPLIVDEAHGAHFKFHKELPPSSIELGADMAAISIHKTGGALTQASALLINNTVDDKKVLQTINMLQSTSASYLLMSSIDGARYNLDINGERQLSNALNLARYARNKLNRIDGIKVYSPQDLKSKGVEFVDETKLCINVKGLNLTGFEVYDMLYKNFSVQAELGDLYNVLALISIGTTKKDVDRLIKSIEIIAKTKKRSTKIKDIEIRQINTEIGINPREAFYAKKELVDIKDSLNMICGESIMAYPPGIPIISPGEIITYEIINYINLLKDSGAYFTDAQDKKLNKILVVNDTASIS